MTPVPRVTAADLIAGRIDYLPAREALPEAFRRQHAPECDFVTDWFLVGRDAQDIARLTPREGVETDAAFRAIRAVLISLDLSHEHKIGGAGFLLREWFVLAPEAP